jgi:hypothetical protein
MESAEPPENSQQGSPPGQEERSSPIRPGDGLTPIDLTGEDTLSSDSIAPAVTLGDRAGTHG